MQPSTTSTRAEATAASRYARPEARRDPVDRRGRPRPTVRQQLQIATDDIHQALHRHPAFVRLMQGRLTLAAYRDLLARLYGFHLPLERGLRAAPPGLRQDLDLRRRERAPALREDLSFLGMTVADIDALPLCGALQPAGCRAELLGRLYVVEGARLGGRLMAARLDGLLGRCGGEGRRFFTGGGGAAPPPWPDFCRRLEAGAGADVASAIVGAGAVFAAMADWLATDALHV